MAIQATSHTSSVRPYARRSSPTSAANFDDPLDSPTPIVVSPKLQSHTNCVHVPGKMTTTANSATKVANRYLARATQPLAALCSTSMQRYASADQNGT